MYLGAQRVQDDQGGQSVSLYYYVHPQLDAGDAKLRDVRWVSSFSAGVLLYQEAPGRAGGRSVLSFLDVSGPDGATLDDIRVVLAALRGRRDKGARGPVEAGRFGVEFYAGRRIDDTDAEFEELAKLLQDFAVRAFEAQPPPRTLTALSHREGDRTVFAWDEASRKHLLSRLVEWLPATVSIADDTREAFEAMHGSFFPHALAALSPLSMERVIALGGARIVDSETQKTLWFTEEPAE
jgi:hypothetical protein